MCPNPSNFCPNFIQTLWEDPLLVQKEDLLLVQEEDLLLVQEEHLLLVQEEGLLLVQEEDILIGTNSRATNRALIGTNSH